MHVHLSNSHVRALNLVIYWNTKSIVQPQHATPIISRISLLFISHLIMSTMDNRPPSAACQPIVNHLSADGLPWAADPADFRVDYETRKCTNFLAPSSPSSPSAIVSPWPMLEVIPGQRNSYRSSYYYGEESDSESLSSDESWDFVDADSESASTAPSSKNSHVRPPALQGMPI